MLLLVGWLTCILKHHVGKPSRLRQVLQLRYMKQLVWQERWQQSKARHGETRAGLCNEKMYHSKDNSHCSVRFQLESPLNTS